MLIVYDRVFVASVGVQLKNVLFATVFHELVNDGLDVLDASYAGQFIVVYKLKKAKC